MKLRNVGLFLVAYILAASATPYSSTASEVDFESGNTHNRNNILIAQPPFSISGGGVEEG